MNVYYRKVYKIGPLSLSIYKSGWRLSGLKGIKLILGSRSYYFSFDRNFDVVNKKADEENFNDLYIQSEPSRTK
jgi:hypothetical protein